MAAGNRTAVVIGGRGGLIQARWELEAGFSPRQIEARLVIDDGGGTPAVYSDTRTVSGPPGAIGSLDAGFS